LAPGMPAEAARAALSLPSRDLVAALATDTVVLDGAYLRIFTKQAPEAEGPDLAGAAPAATVPPGTVPPGTVPPGTVPPGTVPPGTVPPGTVPPGTGRPAGQLPPRIAEAVQAVLDDLAGDPFAAPDTERLRALGLAARALAAAARVGLLLRVADLVVLAPGADKAAAGLLARLEQPFTTSQARQALRSSRRVAIPLLE